MPEDAFAELFDLVAPTGTHFGHQQHVELTWRAVRRYGLPAATRLVSDGIKRTARYAGVPQKFNATVSRAWVEIVAHHASCTPTDDFAAFAAANPELFDKRLLTRFYSAQRLAAPSARTGWVLPDREPFPFACR